MKENMPHHGMGTEFHYPRIAIIDSNMLAIMGLRQILQTVVPVAEIEVFNSFNEFEADEPEMFVHYFVETNIVLSNLSFFTARRNKTIVLTTATDPNTQLGEFHCLCINVPEQELVRSLLMLEQRAHAHGRNLPPVSKRQAEKILSNREMEVLSLIVQGLLNKEIANALNISITTVITHRKNIMEKLGMRSVSQLTIYAVMQGYVDINKI